MWCGKKSVLVKICIHEKKMLLEYLNARATFLGLTRFAYMRPMVAFLFEKLDTSSAIHSM
jgi:hypothetical protein